MRLFRIMVDGFVLHAIAKNEEQVKNLCLDNFDYDKLKITQVGSRKLDRTAPAFAEYKEALQYV